MIRPIESFIGSEVCRKNVKGTLSVKLQNLSSQVIPLRMVLKKFLELPNVFRIIEAYMNDCAQEKIITSFLNAELWKKSLTKFSGKFMIQLKVFFDDVEINNPLGSNKGVNKIGGVYCKILAIPPQFSSLLENIFLVHFHKSRQLQENTNERIFEPVVNELKYLETTGISIETDNGAKKVYFTLALLGGDNLGMHTILGFHESFSTNHYCHLCRADKKILQSAVKEKPEYLRTKIDISKDFQQLSGGIKGNAVFHNLPNYHITENWYCDVMHDLLEGVGRYVIAKVLYILIYIDKIFKLDDLNFRVRVFDFGTSVRMYNSIPPITKEALQRGHYKCSASEMKLLLKNLGLIIGELVPVDNEAWELYITLREIHCC